MSESPSTELASQYGERIRQDLDLNAAEQERLGAEIAALEAQLRALRENRVVLERLWDALGPQAGASAPDAAEGAKSPEGNEVDEAHEVNESATSADAPASAAEAKGAEVTVAVVPRQKTGPASSGAADSGSSKASADTAGRGEAGSSKASSGKAGSRREGPRKTDTGKASPRKADTGKADAGKASPRKADTGKADAGKADTGKTTPAEAASAAAKPSLVDAVRTYLGQQQEPRSAVEVAEAIRSGQPGRTIKTTVIRTTLESLVARNLAQRSKQGRSVFYTPTAAV
ncbi:hypothetical protein ABZ608_20615 [Streptomyces sp. NPDC013172]|uniref:hypothetical protein n=1 Tax=Streptomyces sp. NPDC013172 TaxID=3155009 RepID=UPI0033FFD5DE